MIDPSPTPPGGADSRDLRPFGLVGESPCFRQAAGRIDKIATCDATTLIEGETGTGKELAARAIHYLGTRRDYPFVPVNCGALPDALVENELFGHARGAYTDARDSTRGVIADAEGGTLFLDEIEALSQKAQVALLRLLQDGQYRPLGSRQNVRGDIRIVAASNTDLTRLAEGGSFRWDLLYRLRLMTLEMPPLRRRTGDVRLLLEHFLSHFAEQYRRPRKTFRDAAMALLEAHSWPGNVRELENLVHREFLLADTPFLEIGSDSFLIRAASVRETASTPIQFEAGFNTAKAQAIGEFERSFLAWALRECGGNVSRAARRCGKERRTFGKLLKKHGIDKTQFLHA